MSDKKENSEDFLSMWRKKNVSEIERPSVIGDALNQLETIKKENDILKNKINDNIELIKNSENVLKNAVNEKNRFRNENEQISGEFQKKIQNLEWLLKQKDEEVELKINQIKSKDLEIETLKRKIDQPISPPPSPIGMNEGLSRELQSKLNKTNSEVNRLIEENDSLKKKLKDIASNSGGGSALEALCQDLQSDLNKYKSTAEALKRDSDMMKNMLDNKQSSEKIDTEEIHKLRSDLEVQRKKNFELETFINRNNVKNLKKKVEDNKIIVKELKETNKTLAKVAPGGMKGLIDDLQGRINKLKIAVNDRDRKIKELENK